MLIVTDGTICEKHQEGSQLMLGNSGFCYDSSASWIQCSVGWSKAEQRGWSGSCSHMPATWRQGLLSLSCPRCSQLSNGSDSKYWFWAAQLKLLLLACIQALKLVHGWFLKALPQINQYERSCRKIHPSLSQCCKADGCREAVLEKAHGKKMSS